MERVKRERRIRLLILALLLVLLLPASLLGSRMYRNPDGDAEADPGTQTPADNAAVTLFTENGRWGAKTAGGKVLVEPTWYYLRKIGSSDVLIARNGGDAQDLYGLLSADGSLLAPLIYTSFQQMADDIWAAELTESGSSSEQYHLYHEDGTRWQDAAWDTCTYEDGLLTLTKKQNRFTYTVTESDWDLQDWYSEHAVGLHSLRMAWDTAQLAALPVHDEQILHSLGDAAADYLIYLFLTGEAPDASLLTAEDTASLRVGYRYRNCTLASADISRITQVRTEGYPTYSLAIRVTYRRDHADAKAELVNTVMFLTIARNAAGEYTYSGFSDAQALAGVSSFRN